MLLTVLNEANFVYRCWYFQGTLIVLANVDCENDCVINKFIDDVVIVTKVQSAMSSVDFGVVEDVRIRYLQSFRCARSTYNKRK